MPMLDLGDMPVSYNILDSEAEQIYVVPRSEYPFKIIISYADCKP